MGWVASYSKHSSSQSRFRGDFTSLIVSLEPGLDKPPFDSGEIAFAYKAHRLLPNDE